MKKKLLLILLSLFSIGVAIAQPTSEDILNLLTNENILSKDKADSLRADIAVEQQKTPKDKTFTIDVDFRPRSEIRNGYGRLRRDTTRATLFTNMRSRILFTYKQEGKFVFHLSIQDIRVWGDKDPRSNAGTVQIFEAWAEPFFTPKFSVRMGKQKLAFDNQRLFAENDWRPNSGTHDAFNFKYYGSKLSSDLAFAWNQNAQDASTAERFFDNTYNNAVPYKGLAVSYLRYAVNDKWTLSSINSAEAFQSIKPKDDKEQLYMRYTDGGRIEFQPGNWYFTASGYLQSGWLATGKKVTAWYIQPEIRYSKKDNFTVRLGVEIFSGDDDSHVASNKVVDHNFSALYGVAHRFNGSMDFFTRFPADLGNAGLINPYLFVIKNVGKKIELRSDFHLFYSENNYITTKKSDDFDAGVTIPKYLGFENDFLFTYKPNSWTKIDAGASYALPTISMKEILSTAKGYGYAGLLPTWFYVSFSFKPQLFKAKF
jgi:hypothetical protein